MGAGEDARDARVGVGVGAGVEVGVDVGAVVGRGHGGVEVGGVEAVAVLVGVDLDLLGIGLHGHTGGEGEGGGERCGVGGVGLVRHSEAIARGVVGAVVCCNCQCWQVAHRLPLEAHGVGAVLGHAKPPGRAGRRGEVYVVEPEGAVARKDVVAEESDAGPRGH